MSKASKSLILAGTLLVAVPAQQAQATAFEKARFLFHLGAAYYAFNTWVLRPYRQYKFQTGAPGQRSAIVKAGLALGFAAYQVNSAVRLTRNTQDPFLARIGSLLPGYQKSLADVGNTLKSGRFDEQGIQNLNVSTTNLLNAAESQGQRIRPVAVPIPGL